METRSRGIGGRRWSALAAAVALAVGSLFVAGCGDEPAEGGGDTASEASPIAYFATGAANAYVQTAFEAAQAEAEARGLEVEIFDGEFDAAVQERQIQDAITSGKFQSFIVQANDQAGIVPTIERAVDAGIPVAVYGTPIGPDPTTAEPQVDGIVTTISEDVVKGAEVTAEGIVAVCEGIDPCKVALLWGAREVSYEAAKVPVLEDALSAHDNIEIVSQTDAGWLRQPGRDAIEDALSANPDLNVVASASGDQMIVGAQQAVEAAGGEVGLGEGKVALIGYGAGATAVDGVRSGDWYQTYVILCQTMMKEAVAALDDAANGEEVDPAVNQWELSEIGPVVTEATLEETPDWEAEWDG